jgi:hypothetical protein
MDGSTSLSSEDFGSSVFTPFLRRFTDERARDVSETIALYNEVRTAHCASMWAHEGAIPYVSNFIAERVREIIDVPISPTLASVIDRCQQETLALETTIFSFPEVGLSMGVLSLKEHVDLRRFLRAKQYFLAPAGRRQIHVAPAPHQPRS